MPSTIAAIVTVAPVGKAWTVRYQSNELATDLTLQRANEAAERVAEMLRERWFQFVRIKVERPKQGRWAKRC